MSREAKLSISEKLLLAAAKLEAAGKMHFSAEDLVVSAWRTFPHTFGLSGHQDDTGKPLYPDSNRVYAEIMGAKPIRKRGLLVKVGEKMYELTQTGRELAAQLQSVSKTGGAAEKPRDRSALDRGLKKKIEHLLASRAVQKVDNSQQDTLSFFDACVFWGITPQSSSIELEGRLKDTMGLFNAVRHSLQGEQTRFGHGGKIFGQETLALLERTNTALLEMFASQLVTIRKRTDQRKV